MGAPLRSCRLEVAVAVAIVFETHSLSTDNEAGLATGWLDGRLSERGKVLAGELGRRRRHDGIAAVFASDLGRAVETVELAFGGSGIPVHLDARLRECNYGAWNGMPVAHLERQRAVRISRPFPGGECYQQVVDRVADFLEELAHDWTGRECCWSATPRPVGPWTTCWSAPPYPSCWWHRSAGRRGGPTRCRRGGSGQAWRSARPTPKSSPAVAPEHSPPALCGGGRR